MAEQRPEMSPIEQLARIEAEETISPAATGGCTVCSWTCARTAAVRPQGEK